jgi:hypothetical protein
MGQISTQKKIMSDDQPIITQSSNHILYFGAGYFLLVAHHQPILVLFISFLGWATSDSTATWADNTARGRPGDSQPSSQNKAHYAPNTHLIPEQEFLNAKNHI